MFKKNEFVGKTLEDVLAYLDTEKFEYKYNKKRKMIIVGESYYYDHYEMTFKNDICDSSFWMYWG